MHDDDGQRFRAVRLPVAVAKHLDAGRNFNQTLFGRGQTKVSPHQEAGHGLGMSAAQPAAWHERLWFLMGLRSIHHLILNRDRDFPSGVVQCRSSSTFARNASTSSKRSSSAKTKPPARSVKAGSSHPNSPCLPCRQRAARLPPCPRGPAVPAAIHVARAPARSMTSPNRFVETRHAASPPAVTVPNA